MSVKGPNSDNDSPELPKVPNLPPDSVPPTDHESAPPSELDADLKKNNASVPPEKRDPLGLDICSKTHIIGLEGTFNPGNVVDLAEANGWWQASQGKIAEVRDLELDDPTVLAKMKHKDWKSVIIPKIIHGSVLYAEYLLRLHVPTEQWPEGLAAFHAAYKDATEFTEEDFL